MELTAALDLLSKAPKARKILCYRDRGREREKALLAELIAEREREGAEREKIGNIYPLLLLQVQPTEKHGEPSICISTLVLFFLLSFILFFLLAFLFRGFFTPMTFLTIQISGIPFLWNIFFFPLFLNWWSIQQKYYQVIMSMFG